MRKSRKKKKNIRVFERIVPALIVVICILLFRGTGICAGGMGGMHDQCTSNFQCSNRYFCEKGIGECEGEGVCEDKPMSCPDEWQPVCGCDENTYPNECEADRLGISVDYIGQCMPGVTQCTNNTQCPVDSYCQKSDAHCTGQGTCAPRPAFCVQIWDPVCGCDENIYPNECEAAIYGVNVAYDGECSPGVTGCTNNSECSPDSCCKKIDGDCTGQGTCAPRPLFCTQVWDPVCGCDGVTYPNKCEAEVQGVNVAYNGECKHGGGIICSNNSGCSADSFCQKNTGNCTAQGICTRRPHMCPQIWGPFCGCDGKTYSSECEAAASGVSVNYDGECRPSVKTCTSNSACPTGSYCQKSLGNCGVQGECVPAPQECPEIWSPVCGCDGKTHPNECFSAASGINIDYVGECSTATEPCTDSSSCSTGEYCQKTPGKCNTGEGQCVTRPEVCPKIWAPVCGCDGKTYPNVCEASVKGINVDYTGECAGTGPACINNSNCPLGTVCQKTPGKCTEMGFCSPPPAACAEVWAPVCGCDGKTYPNGCTTTSNGVNIDYPGQCSGSGTTCTNNSACPPGSYCDKTPGDCTGQGECVPAPEACVQIWAPVCGCDGKTHPNECEAVSIGINIDYTGECSAAGMLCQNNLGCPSFAYCKKSCSSSFGECTLRPEFCIQVNSPVCGCDGKTYSNECVAAANGVNVKYTGECKTAKPPPGWPYGGFLGGLPYGGFPGGLPYGGFVGGVPYGGFVGGVPYGGYIGGTPYGGYIGGAPYGGFVGGTPYGGYIGGVPYGGFVGGTPYGGFVGGSYPYGRALLGGLVGGTTFGGFFGTTFGGFIGGNYPYGGYPGYPGSFPFGSSSGTRYPTTIL